MEGRENVPGQNLHSRGIYEGKIIKFMFHKYGYTQYIDRNKVSSSYS